MTLSIGAMPLDHRFGNFAHGRQWQVDNRLDYSAMCIGPHPLMVRTYVQAE
jgi:hypothetical protein